MADFDPDAFLAEPAPAAAAAPAFDPDAFLAAQAPTPAAAQPPASPSLLQRAKGAMGDAANYVFSAGPKPGLVDDVADAGRSVLRASGVVGNAVAHPVDTYNALKAAPGANLREGLRGVNANIPFGNRAVAAMGGPPVQSEEDQKAAIPGMQDLGGVVGLPLAGMSGEIAGKTLSNVAGKASDILAKREGTAVYKDLGRAAKSDNARAKLMDVGPKQIQAVDQEFGISTSPKPVAAVKAAQATVGAARDAAYQQISAAGGDVAMDAVTKGLDELQTDFAGKAGTRPFAKDVAGLRSKLLKKYGETGTISPAALQDQISAIDNGAYGGNYANPKTAQIVQRRTAGALRDVQNASLDAVAQLGPDKAAAVQAARDANAKFAALKTMEPIVKAKALRSEFRPGIIDRALDQRR